MEVKVNSSFEGNDINILPQHRLKTRQTNLIPAICFYNGSFVPIHAGHVNVLEEAKRYINNLGTHELIGAYISPSHSGYVARKLKPEEIVGVGHRLSMIHLAVEHLDWVMVDLFETFQPSTTYLYVIMEAFINRVRSQLVDGKQIDVFWLQGEDALKYMSPCDGIIQSGYHSIYVINRGDNKNVTNEQSLEDYYDKQWQHIRNLSSYRERIHIIHTKHMNLSSSNIRATARNPSVTYDQLQLSTQIDHITKYIFQHDLWRSLPDTSVPVLSNFPETITNVTPKTLSHMLSVHSNASVNVISFDIERIGIGKGWGGSVHRLYNIRYSCDSSNHPAESLVLKLSNGFWNGIVASIEPEFYLKLKPRISNIEIPKCYYVARHPSSSIESILLLEDLTINYDSLGSQYPLEDSTVFSLITSIATLHAEFFKHPLLRQEAFAWLPSLSSSVTHYQNAYTLLMNDKEYTQSLKSKVSDRAYTYAKSLVTYLPHLFQRLSDEYYTLSHGDFWINNVFQRRDQPYKMVLFDWQTCCRSNGLIDVVFFLRLLGKDRARLLEPQVLKLYHRILIKYGILHYQKQQILDDYYSLALPFMFVMYSSWRYYIEDKLNEMASMLEDIVTYTNNTKRNTSNNQ